MGNSAEHGDLEKIWRDSLNECKSHLDRITYEDFKLLMKGQPKERRVSITSAGGMLMTSGSQLIPESTSLHAVPESEEKAQHPSLEEHFKSLDPRLSRERRDGYKKARSRSYEAKAAVWDQGSMTEDLVPPPLLERNTSRAIVLPGLADDKHAALLRDSNMSPLAVNRALYRKHREMRLAVLEASKQFDKKRQDVRNTHSDMAARRASLIMKRGERPPVELEDAHQKSLFESAAKRCGRSPRRRNKTVSDVTELMMKPKE